MPFHIVKKDFLLRVIINSGTNLRYISQHSRRYEQTRIQGTRELFRSGSDADILEDDKTS